MRFLAIASNGIRIESERDQFVRIVEFAFGLQTDVEPAIAGMFPGEIRFSDGVSYVNGEPEELINIRYIRID